MNNSYYTVGTSMQDVEYSEVGENNKYNPEIANRVKKIISSDFTKNLLEKNGYTVKGAAIGGGVLFIYSIAKKRSILIFTAIGVIVGGMTGNFLYNIIKK